MIKETEAERIVSQQQIQSDRPEGQMSLTGVDPLEGKEFSVRKRDGRRVPFNDQRIFLAIESAFRADLNLSPEETLTDATRDNVTRLTHEVSQKILTRVIRGEELEIERIQDTVEDELMRAGYRTVARRYIVYREERRKARALRGDRDGDGKPQEQIYVTQLDGRREPLNSQRIRRLIVAACQGLEDRCSFEELFEEIPSSLYDGVRTDEISKAMIFAARARIEKEASYSFVAARLLLNVIYHEALGDIPNGVSAGQVQREKFTHYLEEGIRAKRLSPSLLEFDLEKISNALRIERDRQFNYMGLQTIYDRYLIHQKNRRIETPQYFWMRVSMGLAMNEGANRNERAIEFYDMLSSFRFTSSTPTLFNAGTLHPQLSSCYLSTVMDDLDHIFKVISDDAKLSKWAGGLGNDWTNVRATGAHIKGTNGESQGVIPFLKVANDTAVAVNQGGKRKGAMCAYLETWHLDIEDFIELRKNTGDERRRTHDMNTANWIPDLFMKRVKQKATWTLFSPDDVADLHDLYGSAFEKRYAEYETMVERGEIELFKKVEAEQLWRKMLTMLFETGHPWITFKDPSNVRSPQSHVGIVHSSNLCTEILLNTSEDEIAVCNLGSVNLVKHIDDHGLLDETMIAQTVRTAMRMLDNVIDINYYPTPEAKNANLRHRPVGLGIMGFQDALYKLRVPYTSNAAIEFADRSMEMISYYAILSSTELAAERGTYESYPGSKWSQGLLPIDTVALLTHERGGHVDQDRMAAMDWSPVRESLKKHGMRNSNTMAIAPTATISNITGVSQSIEPTFKNLFAKSNLSGDFTTVNTYLVEDLKGLGLWDAEMVDDLKYFDGSVQEIERVPEELKELYRTAFEIDSKWLIECASRRQKWIDMGQSLNLYVCGPSGKVLSDMYVFAWEKGLKTTYYLRNTAATTIEKSTMDINKRGVQPRWMKNASESANIKLDREAPAPKACLISDPTCEACQ